VQRKLKGEQAD